MDWIQNFIDSEFVDELMAYKLREAINLNQAAIFDLESRNDLLDYEKQDLEDCKSWAKSLEDVYCYFGGSTEDCSFIVDN